jgi:hypothetical protein
MRNLNKNYFVKWRRGMMSNKEVIKARLYSLVDKYQKNISIANKDNFSEDTYLD